MSKEDVTINKKETKEILREMISDTGYWQWWDKVEEDIMLEFGGIQYYDETSKGKKRKSGFLGLCFFENTFIIFLCNNNTIDGWIDKLHEDEIEAFSLDPERLIFDDSEYAMGLMSEYERRSGNVDSKDDAVYKIKNAKHLLAGTCGDYGFIAGGDIFKVISKKGFLGDDDVKISYEKWWEYWKDYWNKRGTEDAYEEDYACEVTIPFDD